MELLFLLVLVCRVAVSTQQGRTVDYTELQPWLYLSPGSQLYFELNGRVYHRRDTVLITEIGAFTGTNVADPASSLVCETSNVYSMCCRGRDGQNVGEWFFPNGTMVPRNSGHENSDFTRSGFTRQVRLNRRNNALIPTGEYTCQVPDEIQSTLINSATITLILGKYVTCLFFMTA